MHELPQSFKDFLKEIYSNSDSKKNYCHFEKIVEQFECCSYKNNQLIGDRLQYITTEYTDDSPPSGGDFNYRIIFKDVTEDVYLAFTPHMSSWFEWESWESIYQECNWKKVQPQTVEVIKYV